MTLNAVHLGAGNYPNPVELDRRLIRRMFGDRAGRLTGLVLTAGTGMTGVISAGDGLVRGRMTAGQGNYFVSDDATYTVAWPAPSAGNPRIDALVLAVGDLQYGALGPAMGSLQGPQWIVVSGTPAATPAAPTDAQITTAVGAGGWERWYDVQVNSGDTTLVAARITDRATGSGGSTGAWVNSRTEWTASAGWSIQSARRIQVPGTPLWRHEVEMTRTGATITAGANGGITNTAMATLNATAQRPAATLPDVRVVAVQTEWNASLSTGGVLTIRQQLGANATIPVNSQVSVRAWVSTS